MTESEKNRMVKEVLLQATANNKEFQEAMARNASQNAPKNNTGSILLGNASTITIFGLATLLMLGLNLSGCSDVSWWVVFLPIAFEWVMKAIVVILNNREK